MGSNPIGKGKVLLNTSVSEETDAGVRELARKSGMSRNAYTRALLDNAVAQGLLVMVDKRVQLVPAGSDASGSIGSEKGGSTVGPAARKSRRGGG